VEGLRLCQLWMTRSSFSSLGGMWDTLATPCERKVGVVSGHDFHFIRAYRKRICQLITIGGSDTKTNDGSGRLLSG